MRWILRDDHAQFAAHSWVITTTFRESGPHIQIKSRSNPELQLNLKVDPISDGSVATPSKIPLGDAYVRLNDLIASFAENEPWTFGYQIDVRCIDVHASHCACLELWLSVQTSLLDSYPQLGVHFAQTTFAERIQGVWISDDDRYCIAVHPLDHSDCKFAIADSKDATLSMQVFGRFMEKGVIRRMRFRLFASESSQSTNFWSHQVELFSRSPLPLTT